MFKWRLALKIVRLSYIYCILPSIPGFLKSLLMIFNSRLDHLGFLGFGKKKTTTLKYSSVFVSRRPGMEAPMETHGNS